MLEAAKDRIFVAPGIAILLAMLYEAEPWGVTHAKAVAMGYQHEWDAAQESLRAMHKRGIRILPGGDYGFAMTPHCQNARDLEFFVKSRTARCSCSVPTSAGWSARTPARGCSRL